MKATSSFAGIIPPVSTMMTNEGMLHQGDMGRLIDYMINAGVHGLFFLGTGGEFSQMSAKERMEIAEFAVEYVKGRVPVLIGTGSTSTREAEMLTKHAERIGADGAVVINPYYWPLSAANLRQYFSRVADAVQMPILLYNFPNLTKQDLSPDFVSELAAAHANVLGIKETVDSAGHIREMILKVKDVNPRFSVLCGYDDHLLNTLLSGGDGTVSATGNFAAGLLVSLYDAYRAGQLAEAEELHRRMSLLPMLYKLDSPFVNVVKAAIRLSGLDISPAVLPPAQPLAPDKLPEVERIMRLAGLLPRS